MVAASKCTLFSQIVDRSGMGGIITCKTYPVSLSKKTEGKKKKRRKKANDRTTKRKKKKIIKFVDADNHKNMCPVDYEEQNTG